MQSPEVEMGEEFGLTFTVASLFVSYPDWRQFTSHKYQRRELNGYYPSRYVMIDFSHLGDEAHVTFYPAYPSHDRLSIHCNDLFQSGWSDRQIAHELAEQDPDTLEFDEFHVTFRVGRNREHVFYGCDGAFRRQTLGIAASHRAIANRIALQVAVGVAFGCDCAPAATFVLLENVSAYTEPLPTRYLGFTLHRGARLTVSRLNGGYCLVALVYGSATYHSSGVTSRIIYASSHFVPAIYIDRAAFNPNLMRLFSPLEEK